MKAASIHEVKIVKKPETKTVGNESFSNRGD